MTRAELIADIEHLPEELREKIVKIWEGIKERLNPEHHAAVDAAVIQAVTETSPTEKPTTEEQPAN